MRALLFAFLALLMATSALAGQNPNITMYVDFDPPNYDFRGDPTPNSTFDVYLCADTFGEGGALRGVSLVLDFTCSGFVAGAADVTVLHPNAQTVIGGPDNTTNGWVVAAPVCVYPSVAGIVTVARIPWFYLGTPGNIVLLPSPVDGKATVDCNNDLDFFCVYSNGGVGQDPSVPGDAGCHSPVEEQSWGAIKALYR